MTEETKDQSQDSQETQEEIKNIVKIEDLGTCKKKITVEIPEEKIKSVLDKRYEELRKDTVLPGFRKGRANPAAQRCNHRQVKLNSLPSRPRRQSGQQNRCPRRSGYQA